MPNDRVCFACGRIILEGSPRVELEFVRPRAGGTPLRVSMVFGSTECLALGAKDLDAAYRAENTPVTDLRADDITPAHGTPAEPVGAIPAGERPMGWRNLALAISLGVGAR